MVPTGLYDIRRYVNEQKAKLKEYFYNEKHQYALLIFQNGTDPAAEPYIKGKAKDCLTLGVEPFFFQTYFEKGQEAAFLRFYEETVKYFRGRYRCGIIFEKPFNLDLDWSKMNLVSADVDGIVNKDILPCTARGIIDYLDWGDLSLAGKHVVIINRTETIGRPLIAPLLDRNATVSVVHSKTKEEDKKNLIKAADVVISATGQSNFIKKDDIKENAILIDAGISFLDGKIIGDCEPNISEYQTPVPGGVGLLTRLSIFKNLKDLYIRGN